MTKKGRGAVLAVQNTNKLATYVLTQRKHRVQHVEQPSLLPLSLLGEVLFIGRRLHEQPRLSTPYCSGNLKPEDFPTENGVFSLKIQ